VEFECEYLVLDGASWPVSQAQVVVTVPREIQEAQGQFEAFYKKVFEKKQITWMIEQCSSLLKGTFGSESY